MNKKVAKPLTVQDKVQKILWFLFFVFVFGAAPLILISNIEDSDVTMRSAISLLVAFITFIVLFAGNKIILPLFLKDKETAADDDEDLFV